VVFKPVSAKIEHSTSLKIMHIIGFYNKKSGATLFSKGRTAPSPHRHDQKDHKQNNCAQRQDGRLPVAFFGFRSIFLPMLVDGPEVEEHEPHQTGGCDLQKKFHVVLLFGDFGASKNPGAKPGLMVRAQSTVSRRRP
jgi:hypothetical protein